MASGNLGSLWMSLGLKESVSNDLKKLQREFSGTDEKAKKVQDTIKEINSALRKPADTNAISGAFSKLTSLLEKSKTDAKDLAVVLKSLNAKDVLSIFDGKVTATNAKSYLDMINKIRDAINGLGRAPGENTSNLMSGLNKASQYLGTIAKIKDDLKTVADFSKGLGNNSAFIGSFDNIATNFRRVRQEMLSALNDGTWEKMSKELTGKYSSNLEYLLKQVTAISNASSSSQTKVAEGANSGTTALKKEEEQAKKTAEAVEKISSSASKPMKEANQERGFNKEVDKLVESKSTMREGANDLADVKRKADNAKEAVVKLKYELNEVLNAFRGAGSKNLGVGEAGEKGRQLVDILNQINKKREELSKKEGGDKASSEMGAMVSNALSYLRLLQRIEVAERNLQDKKSANPNVDASRFKEASNAIAHFKEQLMGLESSKFLTGVDSANVLRSYRDTWQMTLSDVDKIIGKFQKRNPLSDLDSNFSRIDAKIDLYKEKLAKLRDLMGEGTKKGYDTSMLGDRITGMGGIVTQMEKALANDGKILSNADRMKQLFNDMSVEWGKVTAAMQAYGREKGKVIALERADDAAKAKSAKNTETLADNTRKLSLLYKQLGDMIRKAEDVGMNSLNLGVNTSKLDSELAKARELSDKIQSANPGLLGKGGRQSYKDYSNEVKELKIDLDSAVSSQKKLNTAQERVNTQNAAKAARDAAEAERKRQNEIKISEQRYNSLDQAIWKLRREADKSVSLNVDTSKIDEKIKELEARLQHVVAVGEQLKNGNYEYLGRLGNVGNGRDVTLAGRVLTEQKELNRQQEKLNNAKVKTTDLEKQHERLINQSAKAQADLVRGFERANNHAGKLNSTMQDLKSLFLQGGLVFGAQQFAMSIITTGGEMEKQHIALQSILGDMQNANTLFGQIKELALNSPFTFSELNRDVKQLAAYGVEYDQLYDTTKRLADMSSGLGVSFDRIALAFGQVQARGWLDGKELRQIAYAGIPLLNKLSEYYSKQEGKNVSTSEIKTRISKREVSFDDVKNIFWQMTDAGGQFYNMQQTLSETLLGRYNKLKDAWEIMLADFAKGDSVVGGTFKNIINMVTDLVQSLNSGTSVIGAVFKGMANVASVIAKPLSAITPLLAGMTAIAAPSILLKKGMGALSGNVANGFLSAKGKVAEDITYRVAKGEQISEVEQRILQTKKMITDEDLRNLASANAITKAELDRLMVSGKISKELYRQNLNIIQQQAEVSHLREMAMLRQQGGFGNKLKLSFMEFTHQFSGSIANIQMNLSKMNGFWGTFAARGLASIATIGRGIGYLGKTLWAAVGGLPGIIFAGVFAAYEYFAEKSRQLEQNMKQTADEIADRYRQINEFLAENDINTAINEKDEKQISNLIEAYKEKLKEIAPEKANAFEMSLTEKKSNEERLKYLRQQLSLQKEIEAAVKERLSDDDTYEDFQDEISGAKSIAEEYVKANAKANSLTATDDDFRALTKWQKEYDEHIESMRQEILDKLGDISKDPKLQGEANQIMSSFFSQQGWDQDVSDQFRADVLNSMGVTTNFYEEKFKKALEDAVNNAYPWIGDKIRNNKELTSAEKEQVSNLMKDAATQIQKDYPKASSELKRLLAADRFQAVIRLVFDKGDTDLVKQLGANVTGSGEDYHKKSGIVRGWGKDAGDSYDKAYSNAKSDIKAAKAEMDRRKQMVANGKLSLFSYKEAWNDWDAKVRAFYDEWHERYTGEDKAKTKKNKSGASGGHKEDALLKNLQERLSSLKSARQMYQKYKPYMSDDEAKKKTYKLFPNVVGLDLDNYADAVDALIKNSKFKTTTPERRKFLTSVNREKAEWRWDEKDKPAYDVQASERNAYMDRLSSRWDLYKTLLEKTGNKKYAESAWIDAFQMDDKSKSLMDLYYQNFGKLFNAQEALNMSDEEAKKTFKSPDEYNEWKKIVDLLRSNYVQSLQDGADAMQQTMSVAQKLDSITEKYAKKRKDAGANQDLIDRYNFLEKEEKSGVLLEQMKSEVNWDGVFGDLGNYTKKELKKVRKDIKNLISGGLLNGMSTTDIKSIYDGLGKLNQTIDGEGFGGLSDLLKDLIDASEKYDEAVKEYNESVKKYGKNGWQTEQARKSMQQADQRRHTAQGSVDTKRGTILSNIVTLADMFRTLGMSDGSGSTLLQNAGGWTESIMKMFGASDKNSSKVGGMVGMFAGLTEAIAEKGFGGFLSDAFEDIGGAVNSIFKDMFGINLGISGADYSSYNKAKAEYDNLVSVWDSLISKKTEYMNIHWGTEATEASKEAQKMLEAEIEQTKIIAQKRLNSGASAGSHSLWYRMWKGSYKYNGQNWQDVAPEISRKYGVQFNSMEDMLNMNSDTLSKIKQDYTGLWANLDGDFRDYLEKLIEYGDKADEMVENLTEKLTGNKFSSLVESWGDAMAQMSNSSDNLVDNFEDNLKKTIVNSMIENIYGDKIKSVLDKAKKYGDKDLTENITDGSGHIISAFTGSEYSEVMGDVEDISKQIEATRDFLKKTYGWSDNSSSSSTNSVKGITEETADILVSYVNAIRLDVSVIRSEQAKLFPEMNEIAKSQLTQLGQISRNTLRNAEAAERIESIFTQYNDNFNKVLSGTKKINVK